MSYANIWNSHPTNSEPGYRSWMVVGLIVYGVDLLLGLNFLVMMWKKKRLRGFGFCLQSETQNKTPERTRKIQLKKLYSAMEENDSRRRHLDAVQRQVTTVYRNEEISVTNIWYLHGCRHSVPDGRSVPDGLMRLTDVMVDGKIVVPAGCRNG
ncbi:hypothetical protein C5167_004676 [Papaver somniferum]|uniref:Uncharacterized protein n=1 Tax=Papaver somniferum TaxID=3469 RepID=A0A4Y7J8B1_PAPSO|nr:hypothetical protein C5167_004676 [Papaver somniferum]